MGRPNHRAAGFEQPLPPALPAAPVLVEGSEAAICLYTLAADEESAARLHLKNADLTGEALAGLSFAHCILEGCRFQNCDLTRASFTDCVLKGCDLSGAKLWESYFSRCRVQNCRALGANFAEGRLFELTIAGTQLRYACFDQSKWERVRVENSCLAEVMLTNSRLKTLCFAQADLSGAMLTGTPLKGLDLRGCTLTNVSCSETCRELQGAVVDVLQAAQLARLLGVVIRE